MNLEEHTRPDTLERYSFLWSEARLVIAAVALFLGGVPPALKFLPIPALYGLVGSLLTLAWIISGVASAYLLWRWYKTRTLFGAKETLDTAAFFVMAVSGLNLGITGLFGTNIGMSISSNYVVFFVVGLLYLATAYHLFRRFQVHGQRVF